MSDQNEPMPGDDALVIIRAFAEMGQTADALKAAGCAQVQVQLDTILRSCLTGIVYTVDAAERSNDGSDA